MTTKSVVRSQIRALRAARSDAARGVERARIRRELARYLTDRAISSGPGAEDLARPAGGRRVAAYEPMTTEPGSIELLTDLAAAGYEVLVPVTLPDRDLDWLVWSGTGALLGPDAIGTAAVVLVPAYAVDPTGNRLGRGGGSYDRALTRVPAGVPIAAVLFDGEVLDAVPVDDWDVGVTAALTPSGWIDFTPAGRRNTR